MGIGFGRKRFIGMMSRDTEGGRQRSVWVGRTGLECECYGVWKSGVRKQCLWRLRHGPGNKI